MTATFSDDQQQSHRDEFIRECRQKAWGAACHADWISSQLDTLTAEYSKLKEDDDRLATEIKTLEAAVDSHTKDNRNQRKAIQERRNILAKQMEAVGQNHAKGQQELTGLYQSIEASLQLAAHAATWGWKEAASAPSQPDQDNASDQ